MRSRSAAFGPEVQRRILCGCFVASAGAMDAYYEQAVLVRRAICRDFDDAFRGAGGDDAGVDVLLTPTTPNPAFSLGAAMRGEVSPVELLLNDVMTAPASLAGLPSISVPAARVSVPAQGGQQGLTKKSTQLPVGLQLVAPLNAETTLLRAAAALETGADFEPLPIV